MDQARLQASRSLSRIGQEIRDARLGAGLTQREVGAAIGRSHSEVSRIEQGAALHVPLQTMALAAAAVGLDLAVRAYPAGDAIRDKGQIALLAKLRSHLHDSLSWRTEVPLQIAGDLRAWDAVIGGRGWLLPVDAEARLHDVQALSRRVALKRRDAGHDTMVLLVADTRHNRYVLRLARADLSADFPLTGARVLEALSAGHRPAASGIVVL